MPQTPQKLESVRFLLSPGCTGRASLLTTLRKFGPCSLCLGRVLFFWEPRMVTKMLKRTSERYTIGSLYPGSLAKVKAPTSFFDPLTGSLMTEPVRLLNTNSVFDRRSLQAWYRKSKKEMEPKCPRTGEPLKGWIIIQPDDDLRSRLLAWAAQHNCNLELISRLSDSPPGQAVTAAPY
ncbi:probable U-box domain-containing protein 17 at C-terminar half [Coccomyxa sp. Obi]|nr:probable U-box domain-containing protein 17 at C-terminar half [Coccomyxa sp. Obi]